MARTRTRARARTPEPGRQGQDARTPGHRKQSYIQLRKLHSVAKVTFSCKSYMRPQKLHVKVTSFFRRKLHGFLDESYIRKLDESYIQKLHLVAKVTLNFRQKLLILCNTFNKPFLDFRRILLLSQRIVRSKNVFDLIFESKVVFSPENVSSRIYLPFLN